MRHLKRKVAAVRRKAEEQGFASHSDGDYNSSTEEPHPIKQEEARPIKLEDLDVNCVIKEEYDFKQEEKPVPKEKNSTNKAPKRPAPNRQKANTQIEKPRSPSDSKAVKGSTSAKNIIKNYGRALQNFAVSNIVLPYLNPALEREEVSLKDFRKYFYSKKKQVRSIAGLRNLLLVSDEDDAQGASFKRIFQEISIIFIKYFSVNWIFSGKLLNKIAHLKCRFKMLRRIKSPENFTYLKGFL